MQWLRLSWLFPFRFICDGSRGGLRVVLYSLVHLWVLVADVDLHAYLAPTTVVCRQHGVGVLVVLRPYVVRLLSVRVMLFCWQTGPNGIVLYRIMH